MRPDPVAEAWAETQAQALKLLGKLNVRYPLEGLPQAVRSLLVTRSIILVAQLETLMILDLISRI
jgi:hypothetical protein